MTSDPDLTSAIQRLKVFRALWSVGDEVDGVSQLTADDLDKILTAISEDTEIDKLGDFA